MNKNSERALMHQKTLMDESTLVLWLRLHLAYVSAKQLKKIQQAFGSLQNAFVQSPEQWRAWVSEKQWQQLFSEEQTEWQQKIDEALAWQRESGQSILTLESEAYPSLLRDIPDPPILIYVKGNAQLLSDPQLAVVGSRNASKSAEAIAEDFSKTLSQSGLTITSGLASGIDAAAHRGGLAGVGKTVAVMGTGIDRIYPARNRSLAHQIAEEGALVSEYPLGTRPVAYNFPKRNRIISGLSTGVLVVEAALKSGSLITARTAMEQGREVFAIPGSIHNPQAKGCHQLIKQGAKLVETAEEILEELSPLIDLALKPQALSVAEPVQQNLGLSDDAQKILQALEYEPMGLDELVVLTKLPASDLQAQLMLLELSGKVEAMSAGRWRKVS